MSRQGAYMQHTVSPRRRFHRRCCTTNPEPCALQISSQKRRTGVVSPKRFIQRLKRDREQFRSYDEHQVRSAGRTKVRCKHGAASWTHTFADACACAGSVLLSLSTVATSSVQPMGHLSAVIRSPES